MESFEHMWQSNRDRVRRVLLALAKDADLAEDCLQDTYLLARSGFSGYAGGNAQAWLSAIARNSYFGHRRRRYFSAEESLELAGERADDTPAIDSDERLSLFAIRQAMSCLEPALRDALLMKHYGGCGYHEIAAHLACSPQAAKHRVWRAMQKLRTALGVTEETVILCSVMEGTTILDWLYGALSPKRTQEVNSHVKLCPQCRQNLNEIRRLSTGLDKAEGDYKILTLIDLDETGRTARYVWVTQLNERQDPMCTWRWNGRQGWSVEYLALQGEPVEVRWPDVSAPAGFVKFEGVLPKPVSRGGSIDAMFVASPPPGHDAQLSEAGIWRYQHAHSPFPKREGLFVITIRLPHGAKLINVEPAPQTSSRRTGRVSLTWRLITRIIPPELQDIKWQFEADLEYSLAR